MRSLIVGSIAWVLAPALAQAQVDARVARVRDGQVRFSFALRPGVCGYGQSVWTRRGGDFNSWGDGRSRDVEYDTECDPNPGRVVIERREGEVTDLRFYVGGRWRANAAATDLGTLSARDAATVLLGVVGAADGKGGRNAIFPLTMIDSVQVWRDLMRVARDNDRPRETRKQAVFWLGQLAEEPATAGLKELVGEAALDREVREQAVFALSQRPKDEGVPALINVVRTNRDPEIRKKALFWLGQSNDKRALDLFEELLARRP